MPHLKHQMKRFLNFSFLVLILSLTACTDFFFKEVDAFKIPPVNSKLAVYGRFESDSTFFVALTQSAVIGDSKQPMYALPNAKVYICVDGDTILLTETKNNTLIRNRGFIYYEEYGNTSYSTNNFSYYTNPAYTFLKGKTYTIGVEANGKTASATGFVPDTIQNLQGDLSISYFNPETKQVGKRRIYVLNLSWDADAELENNYYAIELSGMINKTFLNYYIDGQGQPVFFTDTAIGLTQPNVYDEELGRFSYGSERAILMVPAQKVGDRMQTRIVFHLMSGYDYGQDVPGDSLVELTAKINKVNKPLVDFHKTFYNYELSQGNPFAEPVRIKSNVSTGLGYVSGVSIKKITFKP